MARFKHDSRMYESKSFVYLDLQKTGTNFIVDFLRRYSCEGEGIRKKHKPTGNGFRHDKLHFISVRDPLDQYVSLYSFGCGAKGALFDRLKKKGHEDMYEGSNSAFQRWLKFVLDPQNAHTVEPRYARAAAGRMPRLVGFQSHRFLYLAVKHPDEAFAHCSTRRELVQAYEKNNIISVTIRYSQFASDLKTLVRNHLPHAIGDMAAALQYLDAAPALNASNRIDEHHKVELDEGLWNLLRDREWLFYDGVVET